MNNRSINQDELRQSRRVLPYVVEFIKFSVIFIIIITVALVTLHVASAAMP